MELLREQELSSRVNINLRVAYPTVRESTTNNLILTKEDFDGPEDKLLDKLGLNFSQYETETLSSEEIERIKKLFLTLVSRYIGLLSCVPLKSCPQALEHGLERINLEIKAVLHAYRSQISEEQENEIVRRYNQSVRELLQCDELSTNIKKAIDNRAYREGPFKENHK